MEDLDRVAEVDHDRVQRRARRRARTRPGRLDHEVEQHRLAARRRHQHVAAGAEPGQQRLGHERRHQRRQRGVDGVAAGAQDVGAGLSGQGVAGRDDAAFGHPHRPPNLELRDELGHVDVGRPRRRGADRLARAHHARLAGGLAQAAAVAA